MDEVTLMITKCIQHRGHIELPSYGISMYPFIREGKLSTFAAVAYDELRIGDVCLFVNQEGRVIAHRLRSVEVKGKDIVYIFKGDTSVSQDDPVSYHHILGKLIGVRHHNRYMTVNHPIARLYSWIVMHIPKYPQLSRIYLSIKGLD